MKKEHQHNGDEEMNAENQENTQPSEEQNAEQNIETAADNTENSAGLSTKIEEKLAEANDKYMRLAAEFDNYRKRTLKERMEMMKYGGEDVIAGLLPILDDLDRNAQAMGTAEDIKVVREGISLIHNKLIQLLRQKGVAEIEALGLELDTDNHDAVTTIPAPEKKLKGKIVDVIQKGYRLNDKVIRHAKVIIGE
ncbi:MAG: nucleotide exchange factor GrpE [Prevotellaceae bacterium]|jgi:molecular chaperone GrpE|nr:nucleotide exchange factor GrpE [Prevotellaceae bacterium]